MALNIAKPKAFHLRKQEPAMDIWVNPDVMEPDIQERWRRWIQQMPQVTQPYINPWQNPDPRDLRTNFTQDGYYYPNLIITTGTNYVGPTSTITTNPNYVYYDRNKIINFNPAHIKTTN